MAGGPLQPYSVDYGSTGRIFPGAHVGTTNSRAFNPIVGVEASLGADATLQLEFEVPPSLPTGTAKLRIIPVANATSGAAKLNPKWISAAMTELADTAAGSMNAEGTQTITWAAGENDDYKELKVTLDADTVVAGEIIQMDLVFETTSWTLAAISTYHISIIWE